MEQTSNDPREINRRIPPRRILSTGSVEVVVPLRDEKIISSRQRGEGREEKGVSEVAAEVAAKRYEFNRDICAKFSLLSGERTNHLTDSKYDDKSYFYAWNFISGLLSGPLERRLLFICTESEPVETILLSLR